MNKNLLALLLASLTLSLPLTAVSMMPLLTSKPIVRIYIPATVDGSNIVSAITNLHQSDIDIRTEKQAARGIGAFIVTGGESALSMMFLSALIGVLYKFYCRRLGVAPTI